MSHFGTETVQKLAELNNHLATHNYVNGDLPAADDVRVFESLKGVPSKAEYFELHFWYLIIAGFAPNIRAQWKSQVVQVQEQPKTEAKVEAKVEAKAQDEDDLFGDDDPVAEEEAKKLAEKKKAEAEAGKKKKKEVIAKTIIIFDVKVYEAEDAELLKNLAKKIKAEINPEGLVWGQEIQIQEVAYGAKKLTMSMIVEDLKVSSDDVFEKILEWEDVVQSVDTASMQKV